MHGPQNVKYTHIWYAHPVTSAQPPKISVAFDEFLWFEFRGASHQTVKTKQLWDGSQSKETAGVTTCYVILYKESVWGRSFSWDSECYFASQ